MKNYSVKRTLNSDSFVVIENNLNNLMNPRQDFGEDIRQLSEVGTPAYKRSLRRAFSRAKYLAFFNPDLTEFITLTYRKNDNTPEEVLADIKYLIKKNKRYFKATGQSMPPLKYMFVMEYQKRGSIHVHMIANRWFSYQTNANKYRELKFWSHGFTSVLTIKDFDKNFKPYLYLFKYMNKAERIGKSFIHTSRTFDKIYNFDYADYINKLKEENLLFEEDIKFIANANNYKIIKKYYERL